ncbi:hypothetical protein QR680_013754 [Steinernema hermaphroditum]|uniref:Peptidase A2 domain-containing protein n=1 Tax=Steinernema hermaphroditum TaxID=289476 RepID=A0AA39I6J4_9BILA|nr:hypothetical protein QR680_013754 [Steinernema hermaphroditum]
MFPERPFLLVILALLVCTVSAYQICRSPIQSADLYIALPEEQECSVPPEEEHVKAHVHLYKPSIVSWSVDAWSCMLVNTTYYNTNSFFGDGRNIQHPYGISEDECRQWKDDLQARGNQFQERDHNLWIYTEDPTRPFEWFGTFYNTTTYILAKGTITTFNGEHLFSDLTDVSRCNLTDVKCYLKDRTIVLANKIPYGKKRCVHEMEEGVFEVLLSHEFVIIDKLQIALTYTRNDAYAERCYGKGARQMDNGIIIKFVNPSKKLRFKRDLSQNSTEFFEDDFNTQDVSTRNQTDFSPNALLINARANLAFIHYKRFLLAELDAIWLETCRLHNEFVHIAKAFIRLDPTIGARLWLGRRDIAASLAGDVVMITGCRQVAVERVFPGHKVNGTCFLYKPVLLEKSKQVWFAVPGTEDLVPSSPIEDCYERIEPVTEIDGKLQLSDGSAVEVMEFPLLSDDEVFYADLRDTKVNLNTRGVFNSQLFENSVTNLADQDVRLRKIEDEIRMWAEENGSTNEVEFEVVEPEKVPVDSYHDVDEFMEHEVSPKFKRYGQIILTIGLGVTLLAVIVVGIIIMCQSTRKSAEEDIVQVVDKMHDRKCLVMCDGDEMAKAVASVTNKLCNPKRENDTQQPEAMPPRRVIPRSSNRAVRTGLASVSINGAKTTVIIDTGSNISLCNPDLVESAGGKVLRRRMTPGVAANGTLVSFIGELIVNLTIEGITRRVRLAMTFDTEFVILGKDVQDQFALEECDPSVLSRSVDQEQLPFFNRAFNSASHFWTQTIPLGLQVASNQIGATYRNVRSAWPTRRQNGG